MFFEVFRTLLKCSPIWAQKANACTILELSHLFWYPYHLWKWLSSGDIAVFKIFLQIFLLQRHLVTVFHKWKINFKVFLIDLVPFRYFFHAFWWPNQKKCLVDFSRDTSLWKESTENLSVWVRGTMVHTYLDQIYWSKNITNKYDLISYHGHGKVCSENIKYKNFCKIDFIFQVDKIC